MIKAEFAIASDGKPIGFKIEGHSGFAAAPHDIVCAAVSSMTAFAVNTICDKFGIKGKIESDDEIPLIEFMITDFAGAEDTAQGILDGFFDQLKELEADYPKNISVKKIQK